MTDTEYWARRAKQEAQLAMMAAGPAAMSAHYKLSNACLRRAQLFSEEALHAATEPSRSTADASQARSG
jgi:hypothetical protein